ncbi:unnamed protein product [Rotaria magnacalcarata]|uniref:Uncharacterized protein n=1 Tax=Rotaria magnacalcarata TaxID=392030 RepID=A0A816TLQ1_9BILA|nr:unnamed protein product [Rotaria magnacalcarata]
MLFCGIDDIKSGKIPSNRIGGAEYVTNNIYSNLTLVGEGFEQESLAIVTPKQWLYGQDLDVNILFLKESGNLDNLQVK